MYTSPPSPRDRRRTTLAVAALLTTHLALALHSLVLENPTVDEVVHLPAGISYWQRGSFRLYPHNPPLFKLWAALPALGPEVVTAPLYQADGWRSHPPNKAEFAHEFARINAKIYFELFTKSRIMMLAFSVVGGLVVFAWSRRLYGVGGGLLSLALWCFCPNVLAHARLVTSDVAATALGVLATYTFWRYLVRPNWSGAALAGLALGLAQLSKFSLLLLYGLWPLLWLLRELGAPKTGRGERIGLALGQALIVVALSVLTIDVGYAFEGVGRPLGSFPFVSAPLTRPRDRPVRVAHPPESLEGRVALFRINRFHGAWLAAVPVPLPAHYLLGFDAQKLEADGVPARFLGGDSDALIGYPVYLDGVLRSRSWWDYYLRALAYKVPEGTGALAVVATLVLLLVPRARASWSDELTLLSVPVVVLIVMSMFTNINLGLRYVLPIFPYLFIFMGKVAPWASGMAGRGRWWARGLVGVLLAGTATATVAVHPHYLAYFNVVSGGPDGGSKHLIDSNLDWGQDLVGLKRWADEHARGAPLGLAYFGQINPDVFRLRHGEGRAEPSLNWHLPPPLPGTMPVVPPRHWAPAPPPPGLYAVSVSLVRGLPWRVYDSGRWAPWQAEQDAFGYFQALKPIHQIGHSILIYRISEADAARLAPRWGGPG